MLNIPCPFCGLRNESEFIHGGPVRPSRPESSTNPSDQEWREFLLVPDNPVGPVKELWWHVRGCGLWVTVVRDTVTHEILLPDPDSTQIENSSHTNDRTGAD